MGVSSTAQARLQIEKKKILMKKVHSTFEVTLLAMCARVCLVVMGAGNSPFQNAFPSADEVVHGLWFGGRVLMD